MVTTTDTITIKRESYQDTIEVSCDHLSICQKDEGNRFPDMCILVVNILDKIRELQSDKYHLNIAPNLVKLKLNCRDVIGHYLGDLAEQVEAIPDG